MLEIHPMTGQFGRQCFALQVFDRSQEDEQAILPTAMDVLAFKAQAPKQTGLYPLPRKMSEIVNVSVMPVDHRNYALTWYSLSGATAYLALKALRSSPVK